MGIALNARWVMHAEEQLHENHLRYLKQKIFSQANNAGKVCTPVISHANLSLRMPIVSPIKLQDSQS